MVRRSDLFRDVHTTHRCAGNACAARKWCRTDRRRPLVPRARPFDRSTQRGSHSDLRPRRVRGHHRCASTPGRDDDRPVPAGCRTPNRSPGSLRLSTFHRPLSDCYRTVGFVQQTRARASPATVSRQGVSRSLTIFASAQRVSPGFFPSSTYWSRSLPLVPGKPRTASLATPSVRSASQPAVQIPAPRFTT